MKLDILVENNQYFYAGYVVKTSGFPLSTMKEYYYMRCHICKLEFNHESTAELRVVIEAHFRGHGAPIDWRIPNNLEVDISDRFDRIEILLQKVLDKL